jgi:dTDP-glucose 4,6-dehydratase
VPIISALIFVLFSLILRTLYRLYLNKRRHRSAGGNNILIFGAGTLGQQIANFVSMNTNMNFIGYIDDDPYKSRLIINGNRVVTNLRNLEEFLQANKVNQILLAIANLDQKKIESISKICGKYKVSLKALDSGAKLLLGVSSLEDLIVLNQNTLLGRDQVSIDRNAIKKLIEGKTILITGAGGSIGSEIAKQCVLYSPKAIYLLDRDESSLHALELEIFGTGLMTGDSIVLADIRDNEAIEKVFHELNPQIVFHAAALKHLPILEKYPEEAFKTNVEGTQNVLNLAHKYSVEIFVNISTDKAADPSSILGKSKLQAEKLTHSFALNSPNSKFISVRFGNVIGSRGSVLHAFKYQIDNDLPLTITDPEVTRFFMTVKEAVSLVLQSAVIGDSGETLILDMGKPVKIEDVANFMIEQSGKKLSIKYSGLRPGEKLHEILSSSTENLSNREHPKIFHTIVDGE